MVQYLVNHRDNFTLILCNFLQSPVTFSLLCPNILLTKLFLNTLNILNSIMYNIFKLIYRLKYSFVNTLEA